MLGIILSVLLILSCYSGMKGMNCRTLNNMGKSNLYNVEQQKPNSNQYILCGSFNIKSRPFLVCIYLFLLNLHVEYCNLLMLM